MHESENNAREKTEVYFFIKPNFSEKKKKKNIEREILGKIGNYFRR